MKLDLACGTEKEDGYYGIDISNESNADEIYDLRKAIPVSSNTVEEIKCHSFMEHLTNDQFIELMHEIHRVLINGGKVDIVVPHGESRTAIKDPTHRMFFSEDSFTYFEDGCLRQKQYGLPPFKITSIERKGDIIYIKMEAVK